MKPRGRITETPIRPQRLVLWYNGSFGRCLAYPAPASALTVGVISQLPYNEKFTERAIEEFLRPIFTTLPVDLSGKIDSLGEPLHDLQFGANIRRVERSADPVLADVGKKADLSVPSRQPARADMSRQRHLIELFPRVLLQGCVAAKKEPDTLCQRVMILTSSPH